jgi:hypothetical protein
MVLLVNIFPKGRREVRLIDECCESGEVGGITAL